jgi:hypothetical protein
MYMKSVKSIALLSFVLLGGCTAAVIDRHHFATVDARTNEIINVFRVTVHGNAEMANVRYISGFYDQRAVDLFFNETRSGALPADLQSVGVERIFRTVDCSTLTNDQCLTEQNRQLRTVPIGSNPNQQGAFVMILSSNADAVAGTIGAFAENDLAVGSVMYLATRSDREEAAAIGARSTIDGNMRAATMTELNTLLTGAASANERGREEIYLQMLHAAAAGLMPGRPPRFESVAQARLWFASRPWVGER